MTISSVLIFLLTSCRRRHENIKNEFLGEIPSIQKHYHTKIDERIGA